MLETAVPFVAHYFSMLMLGLAIVLAMLSAAWHRGTPKRSIADELFRWVALLGAGVVGIYTAVLHVFAPERTAAHIGWPTSPFQYEVGMADLTIGVLGIMAFRRDFGFRLAATVAVVCWLGGDAIGHVRQIVVAHNYAPGNAGPWLWSDILVPLFMVATLAAWSRNRETPDQVATG